MYWRQREVTLNMVTGFGCLRLELMPEIYGCLVTFLLTKLHRQCLLYMVYPVLRNPIPSGSRVARE
jgi:hypothetical protein